MLSMISKWLKGTLTIRLSGKGAERFINLSSHHNIHIVNIIEVDGDFLCDIAVKDYKKLKSIAKKTKTIPKIVEKHGFPFIYQRNKKRKGYVFGFALFAAMVYILSLFIWDINIEGGHTYTQEFMTKFLKESDVSVGIKKRDVNAAGIEEYIRLTFKDIGWVSVEVRGTRLFVKIKETVVPQKAITQTTPRHIVASKSGIITNIITRTGVVKVGIGDVVKKGDILVNGVVDIIGDGGFVVKKNPVIADGDIIAKTYYDYNESFSMNYIVKEYTGREKKGLKLSFLNQKFNIYTPRNIYPKYDIITSDYTFHLNDEFYLPFGYNLSKYSEYFDIKKTYSQEEAYLKAQNQLQRYINKLENNGSIILENNVNIAIVNKQCVASGKIIVLEPIIEYKDVSDEEWRYLVENEFSGDNN